MIRAASAMRTRAGFKAAAGTCRAKRVTPVAVISARVAIMGATAKALSGALASRPAAAAIRNPRLAAYGEALRDDYQGNWAARQRWLAYRGEGPSWAGGELQDEHARYHGIGPKNYKRSDERIREDVSDHLSDDPLVDASEIEVSVQNSEVTLNGIVENRVQRRRAELAAEQVSGVSHIQNNLRVRRASQGARHSGGQASGAAYQANVPKIAGQSR